MVHDKITTTEPEMSKVHSFRFRIKGLEDRLDFTKMKLRRIIIKDIITGVMTGPIQGTGIKKSKSHVNKEEGQLKVR